MSSFSRDMLGQSDSFGRSTGVRVNVSKRPSRFARFAAVIACLAPIPAAPTLGLALRAVAKRKLRQDATLTATRSLSIAYWAGLAGTVVQLVAIAGLGGTAWLSVEAASSAVLERAEAGLSPEELFASPIQVEPSFALWEFRPGATHTYMVTNGQAQTNAVTVSFASLPTWTADGPVFGATFQTTRNDE